MSRISETPQTEESLGEGNAEYQKEEELARSKSRSRSRDGRSTSRTRVGRGGYGNFASQAGDESKLTEEAEEEAREEARVEGKYIEKEKHAHHSSGRGGAGNITR